MEKGSRWNLSSWSSKFWQDLSIWFLSWCSSLRAPSKCVYGGVGFGMQSRTIWCNKVTKCAKGLLVRIWTIHYFFFKRDLLLTKQVKTCLFFFCSTRYHCYVSRHPVLKCLVTASTVGRSLLLAAASFAAMLPSCFYEIVCRPSQAASSPNHANQPKLWPCESLYGGHYIAEISDDVTGLTGENH